MGLRSRNFSVIIKSPFAKICDLYIKNFISNPLNKIAIMNLKAGKFAKFGFRNATTSSYFYSCKKNMHELKAVWNSNYSLVSEQYIQVIFDTLTTPLNSCGTALWLGALLRDVSSLLSLWSDLLKAHLHKHLLIAT